MLHNNIVHGLGIRPLPVQIWKTTRQDLKWRESYSNFREKEYFDGVEIAFTEKISQQRDQSH